MLLLELLEILEPLVQPLVVQPLVVQPLEIVPTFIDTTAPCCRRTTRVLRRALETIPRRWRRGRWSDGRWSEGRSEGRSEGWSEGRSKGARMRGPPHEIQKLLSVRMAQGRVELLLANVAS